MTKREPKWYFRYRQYIQKMSSEFLLFYFAYGRVAFCFLFKNFYRYILFLILWLAKSPKIP